MAKSAQDYILTIALLFCLCLIVLAIVLAIVDVTSADNTLMPGEYVLGEDANGPISIFYIGEIKGRDMYRMDDDETGITCYITAFRELNISCER